MLNTQLKYI